MGMALAIAWMLACNIGVAAAVIGDAWGWWLAAASFLLLVPMRRYID